MKRFILLIAGLLLTTAAFSQDYRKNRKEAEKYRNSADYYYGESVNSRNLNKADDAALNNLLKNISDDKSLESLYFIDSDIENDDQRSNALITFKDELQNKSTKLELSDGEGTSGVFRYISKADFSKICEKREKMINNYIAEGLNAEGQLRYGNALRNFYWALMLCYSHPNGAALAYKYDEFNSMYTHLWLQKHIESVLNKIQIQPKRQEKFNDNEFILSITDGTDGVENLDFSYNTGNGTSKGFTESGRSYIKMADHDMSEVVISIELENKTMAKSSPDVYRIIDKLSEAVYFPSARKVVNLDKAKKIKNIDEIKTHSGSAIAADYERSEQFMSSLSSPHSEYAQKMSEIEKMLADKGSIKDSDLEKYFTPEGMELISKLLSYGKVRMVGKPTYKFIDFGDEVICRSIPMRFDFSNNVGFLRDIVFRFDNKTKKVKSIAFRNSDITESQILGKEHWSKEARLTLINFVEDYQTAYALQRKKYLQQIYSDDALIIVGSVLKETKKTDDFKMKQEVKVKYDTLSKSQYLSRLNNVFDNNEFVNLTFTSTKFNIVNNKNNVIGVQLRQEYLSSNYSDVGYLFLMVDLRDKLPVIHVRTWQPNETPVDELIDNTSFILR